jgi:hypothetical protein
MPDHKFNGQYDQGQNKKKEADPVNAMHVFYPLGFGPVRIWFSEIEILRDLFQDTHKKTVS